MDQFRVTVFGPPASQSKMERGLNKYFRRRALSDAGNDGERRIVLRNRAEVLYKPLGRFGAYREPFIEMHVSAPEDHVRRSVDAMYKYARKKDIVIDVSVQRLNPK
jgi:hypothetical protein